MPVIWRWDQGHRKYFSYENLKKISRCLVQFDGLSLTSENQLLLGEQLIISTGLQFNRPADYTVWRQYARVFKCSLVVAKIDNCLRVTDLCRKIAASGQDEFSADNYLLHWMPRFYAPSPAYQGYTNESERVFPACAISKYLLAKFLQGREARIDIEHIFSQVIGNECTGAEPIDYYEALPETNFVANGYHKRQVREMLIFFSQASWLKWANGSLVLDIDPSEHESADWLASSINPIQDRRTLDPELEIINLGSINNELTWQLPLSTRSSPDDILFTEGKKVRVTHLRTERSPLLRRLFLARHPNPICDMCILNMRAKYPWSDNLLEVHHLVPLASSIAITTQGTSIDDVVGLCPNCHRAIHIKYTQYLRAREMTDFADKREVTSLYGEVKAQIRRNQ